jgi:hypothetical protein
LAVARRVERSEHLGGKSRGLREDRLDQVRLRFLEARKLGDLGQSGEMFHDESHVIQRRCIGHDAASLMLLARSRRIRF